jgi:hypothetical protein
MREHVQARCGDYLLLFPAENIELIVPVARQLLFRAWIRRRRGRAAEPVLDLRLLLDVRAPRPAEEGVVLGWRATGGALRLALLADAVEAIVNCYADDLIDVPILPRRLRPLCDQVMRHPGSPLLLRVKPDVRLPFERVEDRRRYARALLAREDVQ